MVYGIVIPTLPKRGDLKILKATCQGLQFPVNWRVELQPVTRTIPIFIAFRRVHFILTWQIDL